MAEVIDGATIEVGLDAGPTRDPFVLDIHHLDQAGSILTPVADALRDVTAEVIGVDATSGATDLGGPLVITEAGTLTVEMYDPGRLYDPANPGMTDPPRIGGAIALRVDGVAVWTGRLIRASHDWAEGLSTLEAEDAIAEASSLGVTASLPRGSIYSQLVALIDASGWPYDRFVIQGAITRNRDAEQYTGTLLDGLQRLQLAELGALFTDGTGRLVFRGRGQGPINTSPTATVGLEPGVPAVNFESANDAVFINAVYIEPDEGPVSRYANEASVSSFGEMSASFPTADLLLVP